MMGEKKNENNCTWAKSVAQTEQDYCKIFFRKKTKHNFKTQKGDIPKKMQGVWSPTQAPLTF